jgi:hypothetical protein
MQIYLYRLVFSSHQRQAMDKPQPKTFNTSGICKPAEHYMLPVLPRIPDAVKMIEGKFCFVIHAPRQSGKTTFLTTLADQINSDGKYYAIWCSLASLRPIIDLNEAMRSVVSQINVSLDSSEIKAINSLAYKYNSLPAMADPDAKVRILLRSICRDLDKDLIVFFDEADCLSDIPLITFLTQLRDGYIRRSDEPNTKFPRSLALVGMRNIRDCNQIRPDEKSAGEASPFNIITETYSLANFTRDEIRTLYEQHTEAAGQVFDSSAIETAWDWSEGQPWLVNALARDVVDRQLDNVFSAAAITGTHMNRAAESLIRRRDTHIDFLLERLKEPRVIKVMDAVFAGTKGKVPINSDDRKYCLDLGLVVNNEYQSLRPANKIYQEIFSMVITDELKFVMNINQDKKIFTDGKVLFMSNLLKEFQKFWRHDSSSFQFRYKNFAAFKYNEAAYTFMLLAYLQKVVNSGGKVHRQFSEDRGVIDIVAIYNIHEYLVEVKLNSKYFSLEDSLKQLAGYLDTAAQKEGWLVVFDRDLDKPWDEKIYWDTRLIGNLTIHIAGC